MEVQLTKLVPVMTWYLWVLLLFLCATPNNSCPVYFRLRPRHVWPVSTHPGDHGERSRRVLVSGRLHGKSGTLRNRTFMIINDNNENNNNNSLFSIASALALRLSCTIWSLFLQNTQKTLQLTCESLVWSVFCGFIVWSVSYPIHSCLTHWGRDKMDAISQTTFSNPFSWMKMYEFWLRFHWSSFPRVQLTKIQHWFR